jgi:hypothetical protein
VDVIMDHDQFALLAARQVEVPHQALASQELHTETARLVKRTSARRSQ